MELIHLRKQIDEIDDKLVALFTARMAVSQAVADYKKANGLPIYVPQREQEILEKLAQKAGAENADDIKELYEAIFRISRSRQQRRNSPALRCGLLGRHLAHSYSPQIHRELGNYPYALFEKEPEELEAFLRCGDFTGINVTIPYKKAVLPYCHTLTDTARALGAVNTLVRRPDGTLLGHNTDFYGFSSMVQRSGLEVAGKKVLVLGSGGASNTAVAVLRSLGAQPIVISRGGENNYGNLHLHADARVIVNATPVGMYPNNGVSPIALDRFPALEGVLDLIYNPARTRLLLDAQARGLKTENGLWMLVAQAKESAEYFTGNKLDEGCVERIHSKLRKEMKNIILIGMPGCGKTTVGQLLAERLGRAFIDADAQIVKEAGCAIPEIFAARGEAGFRAMETGVLERLGKESGLVIATGGGCVTREENDPLLRQNGWILRLDRPTKDLATEGRPLSQGNSLEAMRAIREPLYSRFADVTVENSGTPEQTLASILAAFERNTGGNP